MRTIKPLIAFVLTAIGSALVITFQPAATPSGLAAGTTGATTGTASVAPSSASGSSAAGTATQTPAASTPSATTSPATGTTGSYTDGTYLGTAVEEPWGLFQVQATISGGQLVDVTLVAAPGDRHSSSINNQAVPMLTDAALAAQSAQIDWVSGATWTSQSYTTSLQAALDAATA